MQTHEKSNPQTESKQGHSSQSGGKSLAPPTFNLQASGGDAPVQMQQGEPRKGKITRDWSAALRSTPEKDPTNPHKNTIADIPRNTEVSIIGESGDWYEVEYEGKKGYVHKTMVTLTAAKEKEESEQELEEPQAENAIVRVARSYVGSGAWGYDADRPPYGPGTNKCNLFVYEVLTEAGFSVPMIERFKWGIIPRGSHPPLAGQWANGSFSISGWVVIQGPPQPGDIIAEAHEYSDASGHVGIVTSVSEDGSTDTTVSASASTSTIVENDWGFRGEAIVLRRHSSL